jgi:hypothetical protein
MNSDQMRNSECGMRNGPDKLRTLNVPQKVEVELDVAGQPRAVRRSGGEYAVESTLQSWRIDDEWWRKPISRSYYEVLLEGGARVVLFTDLVTLEWFAQRP